MREGSGFRESSPGSATGGVRIVALPAMLVDAMKRHLAEQFRIERELKEMGPIEGPRLRVDGPSLGQAPQKEQGD